jgi:hypothetical protein
MLCRLKKCTRLGCIKCWATSMKAVFVCSWMLCVRRCAGTQHPPRPPSLDGSPDSFVKLLSEYNLSWKHFVCLLWDLHKSVACK